MNNEILMAFINENTNNSAVCSVDQYDMLNVNITADQLIDLVDVLKNKQGFIYLTDICAAHYPEKVGAEFEVIYHLHNLIENQRVRLKVALAESDINIPTLDHRWRYSNPKPRTNAPCNAWYLSEYFESGWRADFECRTYHRLHSQSL